MPDVREVYEMVTKQKPPEPGALERQQKRQVRTARNRRIGAFAVAAAIGLVAVALILGTLGQRNAPRPADQPSAPVGDPGTVPPGRAFTLDLRTGKTTPLAESLAGGYSYVVSNDGTRVAYSSSSSGGCSSGGVTVANLDGTNLRSIDPAPGLVICAPRWSPDDTRLVYQERPATDDGVGNLFVHDLSTDQRTQITDLKLKKAWWWFLSPRFAPATGEFSKETGPGHVIFHLPRSSSQVTTWDVWSVPETGGQLTLVLRNAAFPMLPASGPEGLRIQFVAPMPNNFEGERIMTGRPIPDSDIRQSLVTAKSSIWWPTMSPDGRRIAYQDGGSIYVVDIRLGDMPSKVAEGNTAEWLDTHTLIVSP